MKEKERKVNKSACVNEDERKREMFTLGDCLSIVYTKAYVR